MTDSDRIEVKLEKALKHRVPWPMVVIMSVLSAISTSLMLYLIAR